MSSGVAGDTGSRASGECPRVRLPTTVVPAEVAMGVIPLLKAGIHSLHRDASRLRARTTPPKHEPHLQPPQPTTVIPAEVAMGGHSLHKAGIHSPGFGASPRLTRSDALHENCLRHLHRWILGSSPRMTTSPGPTGGHGAQHFGQMSPVRTSPRSSSQLKSRRADTRTHKDGIHSPGLGASPRLTGSGALNGNCLRHPRRRDPRVKPLGLVRENSVVKGPESWSLHHSTRAILSAVGRVGTPATRTLLPRVSNDYEAPIVDAALHALLPRVSNDC